MANRREVIGGLAASAALAGAGAQGHASDRVWRVGVVGSGWFGKVNLFALMQAAPVEPVALCDVDARMLTEAADRTMARPDSVRPPTRRPALYKDYREMLSKHELDIVIVATPDHWHVLPAFAAVEAGAHVYIEKPVSVDIAEGVALREAAKKHGRVVQVGTQRRTSNFLLEARDRVVREGRLGAIGAIDVYGYFHQRPKEFPAPSRPPSHLDWDFFCGPAPLVPYNARIHPGAWRAFREFGNGYMGDIGVHMIDAARFVLGLGSPKRVTSVGGIYVDKKSAANVPDVQVATYEYDDLLMTWSNRQWGRAPDPSNQWGAAIYGENGTLRLSSSGYVFQPVSGEAISAQLAYDYERFPHDRNAGGDAQFMVLTRAHMLDFLNAIETGGAPAASIEEGHISSVCCILANMSMQLGRPLRWDAANDTIPDDKEAQALMARPYRAPWRHPAA